MKIQQAEARCPRTAKPARSRGSRWSRFAGGVAATLLLVLGASQVHAGAIKGKVAGHEHLLNPVWEAAKTANAHSYNFREPVPTVSADLRRLFPYIPKELCIAVLAASPQPKMPRRDVLVGGGRTTPVTLVVTPGTELRFINTDPFAHRLYGVEVKNFGSSDMAKGAERIWTVPEPGVYEIRDELVPSLRMWVVSEPNVVAVGYPKLAGTFQVDVPLAGDYTVQPYFAGAAVGTAVSINLANENVVADLTRAPIVVGKKPVKPTQPDDTASEK